VVEELNVEVLEAVAVVRVEVAVVVVAVVMNSSSFWQNVYKSDSIILTWNNASLMHTISSSILYWVVVVVLVVVSFGYLLTFMFLLRYLFPHTTTAVLFLRFPNTSRGQL